MNASSSHSAPEADLDLNDDAPRMVPVRRRLDVGHAAVTPLAEQDQAVPLVDNLEFAHLLDIEQPAPELLAAAAGQTLDAEREHLQLQVAQLASHLHERLREVDRREGQLNARAAELEANERATGLWLRERESQFQQRETELIEQIAELHSRLSALTIQHRESTAAAGGRADLQQRERELEEREQELGAREHALAIRQHEAGQGDEQHQLRLQEIERQAAALHAAREAWQAEQDGVRQELADERRALAHEQERAHCHAARLAEREAEVQSDQERLHQQMRRHEQDAAELAADRQAWAEKRLRQEQAHGERRKALEAELDDRRLRLEARQEWIERQKASLEQVRGEILQLHRQSLEMRLLAEQLWSQITGRLTPAEVTHQIAQLKLKLTEQYRLEEEGLDARKAELVSLGERIAKQYEELSQLRAGLREWAAARQAEIEQQAEALAERELALDEQQETLRRKRQHWQAERWHSELASGRASL